MTKEPGLVFTHHGAVRGVTGSGHQLTLPDGRALLVDCGLFQGAETSGDGRAGAGQLDIGFDIAPLRALVVTHVHIDHVGRVPYLLAAGFKGPVLCSPASAALLPMVIEDALEVGFTRDRGVIQRVLAQLRAQLVPLPYGQWHEVLPAYAPGLPAARLRLQPAGHILGSAYVELDCTLGPGAAPGPTSTKPQRVIFSGDLGAPYTPLLPAPTPPQAADVVVLESTYGDTLHEGRKTRRERLQAVCEHAFSNRGTLLVPAFSIGRTQELLYELEEIIHRQAQRSAGPGLKWSEVEVIVDSPLAADFTRGYVQLDGERIDIRAAIHTLSGFSAHADQKDLLNFVGRLRTPPRQVRLVHGDDDAKATLAHLLRQRHPGMEVVVP